MSVKSALIYAKSYRTEKYIDDKLFEIGLNPHVCIDETDAYDALARVKFDYLIVSVNYNNPNSLSIISHAKRNNPAILVIAIIENGDPKNVSDILKNRIDFTIYSPKRNRDLFNKIRRLIDNTSQREVDSSLDQTVLSPEGNALPSSSSPIVIAWDPDVLSSHEYAQLIKSLGDLARAEGASGVVRLRSLGLGIPSESGVPL